MSAAASLSDARAILPLQQLKQKAIDALKQISGETYFKNKAINDQEIPDTADPILLSRAKQATDFLNGKTVNPFKGLSSDQLAVITYDEGGNFTVNERRAASYEADAQEYAWRRTVFQKATNELNSTGKLTEFYSEALKYYKGLPKIEQAQYPEDYESKLQGWIDQDFNYKTEGQGFAAASERILSVVSKLGNVATDVKITRVVPGAGIQLVSAGSGIQPVASEGS